MIVFAVDPGLEAGLCRWNSEVGYAVDAFTYMEASGFEIIDAIDGEISRARRQNPMRSFAIVAERYTIGQRTLKMSRQYEALEMIGCLRWIAHRHTTSFTLQSRADKSRVSDADLRRMGLWIPDKTHAMDARRHMLVYVASHYPQSDIMRQLAGTIKI
jgi:hypothetical protein